jgi:hypothetical protein
VQQIALGGLREQFVMNQFECRQPSANNLPLRARGLSARPH